ncbi:MULTISPECIES: RNA polymerase sigma factor [unclassified Phyllobacterium]|uniref:RNA polymerase sigma factor n=1 Tax=unclassified Phyllobacterium TaxID=2638441 RepID=UPI003012D391
MSTKTIVATDHDIQVELVGYMARLWRYGLLLSRQKDVAEELVQATCLRAMERSRQYQPGTRLDRWLFSILHSIWIDEVRTRRVGIGQGYVDAETALVVDGQRDIETRMLANQILRKVDALPEAQRSAVFLTYVEGFSYQEVSELLSIPIGTVMSRLASARLKLATDETGNIRAS